MLVRNITPDEVGTKIVIGEATVTILRVGQSKMRLSVDAPDDMFVRVMNPATLKPVE
jgi:sRNA-binding carbon storage regulator CsrA